MAAKQLIAKEGGTYGFEVLWENKRLDLSVEALVLKPEYEALFTDEERILCRNRLEKYCSRQAAVQRERHVGLR